MTIKVGEPWGGVVPTPADLVEVRRDQDVARGVETARNDPSAPPILVRGGDLARTLGASRSLGPTVNRLPIDLLEVRLDGAPSGVVCAHVVARRPWWKGGWWRGPVVLVMNAEFIGDWDVAPRGHPNDGRAEVFETESMSIRHRVAARRRLRSATHVPHPAIVTRSIRTATIDHGEPLTVFLDGRRAGSATVIEVTVVPDAGVVHA